MLIVGDNDCCAIDHEEPISLQTFEVFLGKPSSVAMDRTSERNNIERLRSLAFNLPLTVAHAQHLVSESAR